MQFNFNCEQILGCNNEGFAILEGSFAKAIKPGHLLYVNEILDSMGFLSSKAQCLNTIITSSQKFFSSNHRIFIKAKENSVIGYIKVGTKKLFVRDHVANYYEITPLCVLDFYVHDSQQRGGHGKSLFDYMLKFENIDPKLLAYDRPSNKLIGFLRKHYQLVSYVMQNNNFVVFNEYFQHHNSKKIQNKLRSGLKAYTNNVDGRRNFANIGENLIVKSSQSNNIENSAEYYNNNGRNNQHSSTTKNSDSEKTSHGFSNYFLNQLNTNYYDQIYSKKKLQLLNDFIPKDNPSTDEYIKEQLNFRERETQLAEQRVKQIESNINTNSNNFYDYMKRNEYKTIFDDKKLLERRQMSNSPPDTASRVIGISGLSNINAIKTNILPTTSSAYGAYYNNQDYKNKFFY